MAVFQVSFENCQKLEMVVFILPCVCNLSWPGSAYPEPDSKESLETYTKPGACGEASKNCITLPCPDQLTTHRYFLNFFSPKDSLSLNQENRLSGSDTNQSEISMLTLFAQSPQINCGLPEMEIASPLLLFGAKCLSFFLKCI